jgi:hypothetical protein
MYYEEVDMYGVPYNDHDPLQGLIIVIILIILYKVYGWISIKLNK